MGFRLTKYFKSNYNMNKSKILSRVGHFLVVFIFDLRCEIISDVPDLSDVVLDDQGHIWRHGETHLARETASLRKHVHVPSGKRKSDRLLHLDGHIFLLLID